MNRFIFMLITALMPLPLIGQPEVITLESQVKGNQEQPSVLSIVPWKEASDRSPIVTELKTDTGRLFQHLDRDEFARQQAFYKASQLKAGNQSPNDFTTHH